MAHPSYINKLSACLAPSYRWSKACRNAFSDSVTASTVIERGSIAPASGDSPSRPLSERVMRLSDGGVEVVGDPADSFERELHLDVLRSAPQIDTSSFKDYIEIPQTGVKGFLSSSTARICSNGVIPFKQYTEGSPNAHHYPLSLLPRKFSAKLGGDILVTSFALHEKDYRMEGKRRVMLSALPTLKTHPCEVLLQKLYGRISVLVVFSGDPPYADAKAGLEWKRGLDFEVDSHLLLNYACPVGMSYFHNRYVKTMASSLVEHTGFSCTARKLSDQETISFHQYRRQFSSILLLDRFGYIRWHAVGRPTREARYLLKEAHEQLLTEI
ncbi:hypothetical protein BaOVIS_013070 [Babesia ovis]|uniref:Uncharacterized protein n=1 Tax=Babesia ovis TaxID=5869 RepID=A0A9W5T9U2_BABOV|nr:hypothetical protein BaOVIS_013070 [Babesia ovis]